MTVPPMYGVDGMVYYLFYFYFYTHINFHTMMIIIDLVNVID